MTLRRRNVLAALLAGVAMPAWCGESGKRIRRVLFVGNSYTYHNDLPAVFAQVASAAVGRTVSADMLARGGAMLAEQVSFGALQRIVAEGDFDALVLQERGGLLQCTPRFQAECESARTAHLALAQLARKHRLRGVLLGTYRTQRASAQALHQGEQALASECGLAHLSMSDTDLLGAAQPQLNWVDPDGFHPGPDWTLLAALRLTRLLYRRLPPAAPLTLRYRDYRDAQSPSYDQLASTREVGARLLTRQLGAAEFAARLALVEWQAAP